MCQQSKNAWRAAAAAALALAGLAPATLDAAATETASVTVSLTDKFEFEPREVTIHAGEAVEWRNESHFTHTVTADPKQGHATLPPNAETFSSENLRPGAGFRHTFSVPGKYTYFCSPHEGIGMTGQIIVTQK